MRHNQERNQLTRQNKKSANSEQRQQAVETNPGINQHCAKSTAATVGVCGHTFQLPVFFSQHAATHWSGRPSPPWCKIQLKGANVLCWPATRPSPILTSPHRWRSVRLRFMLRAIACWQDMQAVLLATRSRVAFKTCSSCFGLVCFLQAPSNMSTVQNPPISAGDSDPNAFTLSCGDPQNCIAQASCVHSQPVRCSDPALLRL